MATVHSSETASADTRAVTVAARSLRRAAALLAAALNLAGCEGIVSDSARDGSGPPVLDLPGGDTCVDVESMFADTVWGPTLSGTCIGCHTQAGGARTTRFVLVSSAEAPDFLHRNFAAFEAMAIDRSSGDSLVLQKISGGLPHVGGVLAPRGSPTFVAFSDMIEALALDDRCIGTPPDPTGPYFDGVVLLDEVQTLRKAVFQLASRYPTPAELDAVRGRGIEAIDPVLDAVMREDGFYTRVKEIFNDQLLTEGGIYPIYHLPEAADFAFYGANYPQFQNAPEADRERWNRELGQIMTSEPLNLIEWVLRHERPFSEILTADYTIVNPFSARFYGVALDRFADDEDPDEWLAVTLPDRPQAGLLSTVSFLDKYPTRSTNRNRARSRMVYRLFLATNVLALDAEPLPVAAVSEPAAWMTNPACTVCHDRVDPVAGCFQDYSDWDVSRKIAIYRPKPWYEDMRAPGFNGVDAPDDVIEGGRTLPWLARQIIADRRFGLAMAQIVWTGLTGQTPLAEPSAREAGSPDYTARLRAFHAQHETLQAASQAFFDGDYDFRALVRVLVRSPWFRAIDLVPTIPSRLAELDELGTARVLSPEAVARRLRATFGYDVFPEIARPWSGGALGYSLQYGGIDSRGSTVRATALNAVMAAIAHRVANIVACRATPREFSLPRGERVLFPHVDPADTADGAREAVTSTIIELHDRFFGERLGADHPEIVATFELFRAAQATGRAELEAGREGALLHSQCREHMSEDPTYGVRAWQAVLTFLLSDYRFLHD